MTLYAWKTTLKPIPARAAAGCPYTGWIHEGHPPWRVIVFPDMESALKRSGAERIAAEYAGGEDTVPWAEMQLGYEELLAITRAIHDVDCDRGEGCGEVLTTEGRYGRYASAALAAVVEHCHRAAKRRERSELPK